MGESKRGGGGTRRVTTGDIARQVAQQLKEDQREPAQIRIERVTEGLYACHVTVHGEQEPEGFFLRTRDDIPHTGSHIPA